MKKTRTTDIWDKIDKLIAEDDKPIQADEFTMQMLKNRFNSNGQNMTDATLNRKVEKLVNTGVLSKRKTRFNGFQVNVYRFT